MPEPITAPEGAIRTLVVEDDPIAAEAHAEYVRRVPGYTVVAVTGTGAAALHELAHQQIDLVLLDMNLPDLSGLEICRIMRTRGVTADVIAVTAARDLAVVRGAVAHGVAQYLLKPFTFAALRDRLNRYAEYRQQARARPDVSDQREVDRLLGELRSGAEQQLPKTLSPDSLDRVLDTIRSAAGPVTATEAAEQLGMSRVGARRYLEHLVESGLVSRDSRYGGAGRPEIEYQWRQDATKGRSP